MTKQDNSAHWISTKHRLLVVSLLPVTYQLLDKKINAFFHFGLCAYVPCCLACYV